jgi:hypothetical protein
MNTESPHLDLEELLAEVNGEAEARPARAHLSACPSCQAEAERWRSVADGVRYLIATAPVPREAFPGTGARRRPHPALAAAAAAGILVIGGASYGLTAALGRSGHPADRGSITAGLTAVRGCASLAQVSGTLEQVSRISLVIGTSSGQAVTVTASAPTLVDLLTAPLADITDGTQVIVTGTSSDGTIAADSVVIGSAFPWRSAEISVSPGRVAVHGTVADAGSGGFTVVTANGARIPVTTSSDTEVVVHKASLSQLRTGGRTAAIGRAGPGGTLAATAIVQGGYIRTGPVSVHGCSPSSVDAALAAAFGPVD